MSQRLSILLVTLIASASVFAADSGGDRAGSPKTGQSVEAGGLAPTPSSEQAPAPNAADQPRSPHQAEVVKDAPQATGAGTPGATGTTEGTAAGQGGASAPKSPDEPRSPHQSDVTKGGAK